jgi:hypothetical protein
MVDEIDLRNFMNRNSFRLEVTPELWRALYEINRQGKPANVVTVRRNGVLRGYASYLVFERGQLTALGILDMNAEGKDVLADLVDAIIERGKAEGADIIYFRKAPGSCDEILDEKGFLSFIESVIPIALLNPNALLNALAESEVLGTSLSLNIRGFEPVVVTVGQHGIEVSPEKKPDLKVFTDSETFLKLFFSQTTVLKQFLNRKIKVSNPLKLLTVKRFFDSIKQERWYIPFGDWT